MNNQIIFDLNKLERIVIDIDEPIQELNYYSQGVCFFVSNNDMYSMGKDTVRYNVQCLRNKIFKALNNQLQLHESITKDIGYLYNQDQQKRPGLIHDTDKDGESWVGYRYYLWGVNLITWIYNDKNGDIILEITPRFPGKPKYKWQKEPFSKEEIENFAWYEEWIKQYQPFLTRTITRETAEKWAQQSKAILDIIENNNRV